MSDITPVRVHIDPRCPWAWLTSRWLVQLERLQLVAPEWRLFALSEKNRPAEEPAPTVASDADWAALALIAARRTGGNEAIGRLYSELGEAHHERGEDLKDRAVLRRAAAAASLDEGLIDSAIADAAVTAEWLDDHRSAVAEGAFGVPTLSVAGGPYFYGPVIEARLSDSEADELWHSARPVLSNPHVWEIKRERTIRPQIGRTAKMDVSAGR